MTSKILSKIKKAGLVGRGGAGFPTFKKWEFVKKAEGDTKYVICNASEGELAVGKDFHILKKHPEKVFEGMKLAMDFLETKHAYFNINEKYYKKLEKQFDKLIQKYEKQGFVFSIYKESPSYIGGEETALLNAIEGKRIEPRLKPPFPSDSGLYSMPTLINNVETFYNVALVEEGKYENKRFYTITGKVKKAGIFLLNDKLTIEEVLKETKNFPSFDYFVQVGGSASGPCLNGKQAKNEVVSGAGAIEIYSKKENPRKIMLRWFEFYKNESCGKCTPCREGTYQIHELLKKSKTIAWKEIIDTLDTMEATSFCALGKGAYTPVKTYLKNILHKKTS